MSNSSSNKVTFEVNKAKTNAYIPHMSYTAKHIQAAEKIQLWWKRMCLTKTTKKKIQIGRAWSGAILALDKPGKQRGSVNSSVYSMGAFDDREMFNSLAQEDGSNDEGYVCPQHFIDALKRRGISLDDNRLKRVKEELSRFIKEDKNMDFIEFVGVIASAQGLIERTLCNEGKHLCVPDWKTFHDEMKKIYEQSKVCTKGKVATTIPELEEADRELFAVSFFSCDGQQMSLGDDKRIFPVMSACKPLNYMLALEEHGRDYVHRFVGREPSGQGFNEMILNDDGIPHNPFVESGAIMVTSLIKYGQEDSARFGHIMGTWTRATGNSNSLRFDNSVFLSMRDISDRNFCLGYMLQEKGSFAQGNSKLLPSRKWEGRVDLSSSLDLYSMCCAIGANVNDMACLAATLANDGICPNSGERVFKSSYVRGALTLMLSCGMYDYSGEWAYMFGVPAKSGNSGIVMVVVPNLGGFAVYSPRLDDHGNSARAIDFFKRLCNSMTLHVLEIAMYNSTGSKDPKLEVKAKDELQSFDIDEEEEEVSQWSSINVKKWVESFGSYFSQYGDSIMRNKITGVALLKSSSWTNSDLEALFGMSNSDHQRILLTELKSLRDKYQKKSNFSQDRSNHSVRGNHNKFNPFGNNDESRNFVGKTHFMAATGNLKGIIALYAAGNDLDTPDYDMRTPLHLAAAEKQLEVCKYLINKNVDVNAVDRMGGTPLSDAINTRCTEVIEYLKSRGAQLPPENSAFLSVPSMNATISTTTTTTTATIVMVK